MPGGPRVVVHDRLYQQIVIVRGGFHLARTSLIVGIDEGGTNTDTALVFTPGGDDAAVAEQIAAWGLALSSAGREEEVAELRRQHQSERRRRGLIWVRRSATADVEARTEGAWHRRR